MHHLVLQRALELTALTKDQASVWMRARIPAAAKGSRQTFEGTVSIGTVYVPVRKPVSVAVQTDRQGYDVVFRLDVPLATVPDGTPSNRPISAWV